MVPKAFRYSFDGFKAVIFNLINADKIFFLMMKMAEWVNINIFWSNIGNKFESTELRPNTSQLHPLDRNIETDIDSSNVYHDERLS